MSSWLEQINRHEVVLPSGITRALNGRIQADLLVDVHDGNGRRIGRLNRPAARSFKAMVRHALLDGVPATQITATDTYRTIESQQRLWDTRYDHTDHGNGGRTCGGEHRFLKDGEATAACPGGSNHGYAGAIDKGNGPAWHAWLEAHAGTYGWEWELKSERWHLHYWPGDAIPQAVLDSEATQEDDGVSAESDQIINEVRALGRKIDVVDRLVSEIHPDADAARIAAQKALDVADGIRAAVDKIEAGDGASAKEILDDLHERLKG